MARSLASSSPTSRRMRRSRATSASAASTITTSSPPSCRLASRSRLNYEPVPVADPGFRHRPALRVVVGAAGERRRNAAVLCRTERLRRADGDRSRSRPRDRFRHVRLAGRAAAARAEVGQRLHRQLRLVDHRADRDHQPRDVPAAPQERGVDAEDAGDSARGEGDSGSLREAEDERSGAAEDERRADEPLPRARRQSGERLRADAADAAGAVRVLRDAVGGDRAARRAVRRLDQGPVDLRSAGSSRRS